MRSRAWPKPRTSRYRTLLDCGSDDGPLLLARPSNSFYSSRPSSLASSYALFFKSQVSLQVSRLRTLSSSSLKSIFKFESRVFVRSLLQVSSLSSSLKSLSSFSSASRWRRNRWRRHEWRRRNNFQVTDTICPWRRRPMMHLSLSRLRDSEHHGGGEPRMFHDAHSQMEAASRVLYMFTCSVRGGDR